MILIIDNYDSFAYNLYQIVAQFHKKVRVIRNDKISFQEIIELDPTAIILSPGPGHPKQAGICVALVSELIKRKINIPLLGVCLGHQAISIALGGRVVQAQEILHGKDDLIFHDHKGIYQGLPQPFKAGRYHSLIVERESLPSSLIIEAENANQVIMGMRHKNLPIYGVQFHPESILTPQGNLLLQTFANVRAA